VIFGKLTAQPAYVFLGAYVTLPPSQNSILLYNTYYFSIVKKNTILGRREYFRCVIPAAVGLWEQCVGQSRVTDLLV